jgi:hypothetical protein
MPNKSKTNKKKSKGNLAKRSNAANKVRELSKARIQLADSCESLESSLALQEFVSACRVVDRGTQACLTVAGHLALSVTSIDNKHIRLNSVCMFQR